MHARTHMHTHTLTHSPGGVAGIFASVSPLPINDGSRILKAVSTVIRTKQSTLGVKKVRGQSEAALQIGMYDQKL